MSESNDHVQRKLDNHCSRVLDLLSFQHSDEFVSVMSPDFIIKYLSPNTEMVFGYTIAERLGRSAIDFLHPESVELFKKSFSDIIEAGAESTFSIIVKYKHNDNTYRLLKVLGKNLLDVSEINGILLKYHDIDEKYRIQRELNKANARYISLFESTGNMVWSVDLENFGLLTFNTYMANYYRDILKIELRIGLTPKEMLPSKELTEYWLGLYDRVIKEGSIKVKYPMVSSKRHLAITLNPMHWDGEMIGISVFVNDETKIVEAEMKTREEYEKHKILFENTHEYVILVDAVTYETKLRNPAAVEFIKNYFNFDAIETTQLSEFLPQDEFEFWEDVYEKVQEKKVLQFRKIEADRKTVLDFTVQLCEVENSNPLIMIIAEDMTKEVNYQEQLLTSNQKLKKQLTQSIFAISKIGELRDIYTAGHQKRVQSLACAIATKMGLSENQIENVYLAALIHDIGKVYVPAEILNKPGRLSKTEFELIKTHAEFGYEIVKEISLPIEVSKMVLQHHERIDGSGYPKGLKNDEILLESRILCVADVVEAISSHRPYRAALGIEVALQEMEDNKGTKYDSEVVEACLKLFQEQSFSFENTI